MSTAFLLVVAAGLALIYIGASRLNLLPNLAPDQNEGA